MYLYRRLQSFNLIGKRKPAKEKLESPLISSVLWEIPLLMMLTTMDTMLMYQFANASIGVFYIKCKHFTVATTPRELPYHGHESTN